MALVGTLSDFEITDLVQYPHLGRRSGVLEIIKEDLGCARAQLFYRRGRLIHVAVDSMKGLDALVEVLGWTQGDFEFRPGDFEVQSTTIDLDLHHVILLALQKKDEMNRDASPQVLAPHPLKFNEVLQIPLGDFLKTYPFVEHVSVVGDGARLLAEITAMQSVSATCLHQLRSSMIRLWRSYPWGRLDRVFLHEQKHAITISRLEKAVMLIVVGNSHVKWGTLAQAADHLACQIAALNLDGTANEDQIVFHQHP